jgi:hypothetical protein
MCNIHSLAAYENTLNEYIHEVGEDTKSNFEASTYLISEKMKTNVDFFICNWLIMEFLSDRKLQCSNAVSYLR